MIIAFSGVSAISLLEWVFPEPRQGRILFTSAADRTMSMHRLPDGSQPPNTPLGRASSKWALAVNSIESVTATLEGSIRFGIALFPIDRGGDICVTLEERTGGTTATNVNCEEGEVQRSVLRLRGLGNYGELRRV